MPKPKQTKKVSRAKASGLITPARLDRIMKYLRSLPPPPATAQVVIPGWLYDIATGGANGFDLPTPGKVKDK